MPEPAEVTGLILAGGRSRRFGSDKALADVGGRSFVESVFDALSDHAGEMLIATGPTYRPYPVSARAVTDPMPAGGPIAGLAAGLDAASTPWLLSSAVDLPFLTGAALRPLLADVPETVDAVVARDSEGQRQPTCALWRVATVRPVVHDQLADGHLPLHALLDRLTVREVTLDGSALRNVNLPRDLHR